MSRFWVIAAAVAAFAAAAVHAQKEEEECGMYLAVSSTSTAEEPAWGIYLGNTPMNKSEPRFWPELAILIQDLRIHANAQKESDDDDDEEDDPLKEVRRQTVSFLESINWVPDRLGAKFESISTNGRRSVMAIAGPGALGGYNTKHLNTAWNQTAVYFRAPIQGLENHPGRGAFTTIDSAMIQATKDIPANSEIFIDYGDAWRDDAKEQVEELTHEEFQQIDATVEKMIAFFDKYESTLTEDAALKVYNFIVRDVMNAAVGAAKAERVSAIFPPSHRALPEMVKAGGALAYSKPAIFRTATWLEKHGMCMDNLRPGDSSTVSPYAGRGAYARRAIAAGQMVTPVPLVPLPDASILDMFELKLSEPDKESEEEPVWTRVNPEKPIGKQLLYNYCYGHPESTLLLVPLGPMVNYINHASAKNPDGPKPNVKMVWSNHLRHQRTWLKDSPNLLIEEEEHGYVGLLMEIVALRDIQKDEEILMDYGDSWQQAWDTHVAKWNEKRDMLPKEMPPRAADLNAEYRSKPFLLPAEQENNPYPTNVLLKTFTMVLNDETTGEAEDPKTWGELEAGAAFEAANLFTVEILARHEITDAEELAKLTGAPYVYTVIWKSGETVQYIQKVPHRAFVFVDDRGTSENFLSFQQHQPVFRHYIEIPNDVFPTGAWRNRK
jgi:SET domain